MSAGKKDTASSSKKSIPSYLSSGAALFDPEEQIKQMEKMMKQLAVSGVGASSSDIDGDNGEESDHGDNSPKIATVNEADLEAELESLLKQPASSAYNSENEESAMDDDDEALKELTLDVYHQKSHAVSTKSQSRTVFSSPSEEDALLNLIQEQENEDGVTIEESNKEQVSVSKQGGLLEQNKTIVSAIESAPKIQEEDQEVAALRDMLTRESDEEQEQIESKPKHDSALTRTPPITLMTKSTKANVNEKEAPIRDTSLTQTVSTATPVTFSIPRQHPAAFSSFSAQSTVAVSEKDTRINAMKMLFLKYKNTGDMESARHILRMIDEAEGRSSTKQTDLPSAMPRGSKKTFPATPPTQSSPAAKSFSRSTLLSRLAAQAKTSLQTAKIYEVQKKPDMAQAFRTRAKRFIDDIDRIKADPSTDTILAKEIKVTYDAPTPMIPELGPDELCLSIRSLKADMNLRLAQQKLPESLNSQSWSIRASLQLDSNPPQEWTSRVLAIEPQPAPFHWSFLIRRGDLRLPKYLETRKLRLELLVHRKGPLGFMVFKVEETGLVATVKLSQLTKDCKVIDSEVIFHPTHGMDPAFKALSLVATVETRVKMAIGAKALYHVTETWLVPVDGSTTEEKSSSITAAIATPGLAAQPAVTINELSLVPVNFLESSYEALEEELARPGISELRTQALIRARDIIATAVDNGSLTQEAYADRLKKAIDVCKQRAIEAKRAGNLDLARNYMKALKTMQAEVSEDAA